MVLVTGATGFVGKHLIKKLLESNHPVRVLLRPGSRAASLKDFPVEKVMGNPFNPESLEQAFRGVDYVIHCAGVLKGLKYDDYFKGNVLYTENLLKAAKKFSPNLKKFIYLSSQAAAGPSPDGVPKKESDKDEPLSWYGLSKLSGEKKVKESGLPYLVFRPSGIYGPADHEFLPIFKMAKMGVHVVVGDGLNQINLLHVFDLVRTLVEALESKQVNQSYYIADGKAYNWKQISALANQAVGKNAIIIKAPRFIGRIVGAFNSLLGKMIGKPFLLNKDKVKEGLQRYWVFNISKIQKDLNFQPQYYPEQAFKDTYDWYKKEGWL